MVNIKKINNLLIANGTVSSQAVNEAATQCVNGDGFAVSNCFNSDVVPTAFNGCRFTVNLLLRGAIHAKQGNVTDSVLQQTKQVIVSANTKTITIDFDAGVAHALYEMARAVYATQQILLRAKQDHRGLTMDEFKITENNLLQVAWALAVRRFKSSPQGRRP